MQWSVRFLVVLSMLAASSVSAANAATTTKPYIVVLDDSIADPQAVAAAQARALGFQPTLVYRHALKGYAADLSEAAVRGLLASPTVAFIEPDRAMMVSQEQPPQPPQFVSEEIRRIDGDESSTQSGDGTGTVNINVAVIDDGVDATHPDLNVVGATDCLKKGKKGRKRPSDPTGVHGTMVGGLIAAIDNEIGVVGVAPGANLWAARSLDDSGIGFESEVICGLDWVTGTRMDADPTNDIAVTNMSLGGPVGTSDTTGGCPAPPKKAAAHTAFCNTIAAGVSIVASAMNESEDFQNTTPATYDEALTATAMADDDGQPGGLAGTMSCIPEGEDDDTAAFFSNFATLPEDAAHTVAAPGVCNVSTYPGGLYAVGSGTSFSAPLVAGTVALCIWSGPCAGLTPQQITQKIVGDAAAYNTANPGYGFEGDPLRPDGGKYHGYLIRAGLY